MSKLQKLPQDVEDLACDMAVVGATMADIAEKLGFKNAGQLARYQKLYPEFDERFQESLSTNNLKLESDLLEIPFKYDKDVAKMLSDNIKYVLGVRDRKRYSQKVDYEVSLTVDIAGALADAKARIAEPMNVIPLTIKHKNNDDYEGT